MSIRMSGDRRGEVAGGNKFSAFVNFLCVIVVIVVVPPPTHTPPPRSAPSEGLTASVSQINSCRGGVGMGNGKLLIIPPVKPRLPVAL